MYIVKTSCWKCGGPMNAAVINSEPERKGGQMCEPEGFSAEELKLAEDNGVIIKEQHSYTMGENYLANTCPHCGTFIGSHYMFTGIYCPVLYNDCEYKIIDIV